MKASSVRYLGEQLGGFTKSAVGGLEKLKAIEKELALIDQFKSAVAGIPNIQEETNRITGYGGDLNDPQPEYLKRDTGQKDWSKAMGRPDVQSLLSTEAGSKMFLNMLSAQGKVQDLTSKKPFNRGQYGTIDERTGNEMYPATPESPKQPAPSQPTYLSKAQQELVQMKAHGATPEQITQMESYIKNLAEGRTTYSAVELEGQGVVPWDSRRGEFKSPTGKFKPTTGLTKTSYTWIQDNLDSMDKLKSLSNLYDANTGFLTGRVKGIIAKGVNSPEYQELRSTLGQLRTIIYGFSGKQINEQEAEWLKTEIIPEMTNPTENFEVKINILDEWLQDKEKSFQRNFPSLAQLPPRPRKYDKKPVSRTKNLEEMTDEELDAYENSLLGRK